MNRPTIDLDECAGYRFAKRTAETAAERAYALQGFKRRPANFQSLAIFILGVAVGMLLTTL